MRIRKAIQHYILVAAAAAGFVLQATSGFVLWFVLPHTAGGGAGGGGWRWAGTAARQFWGMSRSNWLDLHDWAAIALLVVVVAHLALNWKWFVAVSRQIAHAARLHLPRPVPEATAVAE